ncbi:acyl-protein thioesterase 1 [Aspergillus udagawae]|uniref:Acyl-protein thioesterase 1 n=1 Tax=Aspergillus udagawae TaxID=91492 RepID=A0ABQ1AET7_9EURO|nr:acyl-protein thioesterase 1 [Aspergillus udagawae]
MPPSKTYPSPLVIPPLRNDQHTHTIILLHGRGSNGEDFGHVFIESTDIAQRLPTTKFIFPTASRRRSTVMKRIPINQCEFLRRLVDEEAKLLSNDSAVGDGYSRIVIGGLSQGCAAAVFCLLGGFPSASEYGEGKHLGGYIGMSGWVPVEREISGLLKMEEGNQGESKSGTEEDDDDPFAHDTDGDDVPAHIQAVNHIRDILGMPPFQSDADDSENALRASHLKTPVFLGHGSADPSVSIDLGRRMASILSDGFGMDVTCKAYEEFGHWPGFLIEKGFTEDLNQRLSPTERLQDLALKALLEEKLCPYQTYERWVLNFYTMRSKILAALPRPVQVVVGNIIYRKVTRNLQGQGIMAFTEDEICAFRQEIWESLNALVAEAQAKQSDRDGPFWIWGGEGPTEVDAVLFAFTATVLVCDAAPASKEIIKDYPAVVNYARRIHDKYFPEYGLWK